jgi:bifunctional UDP-N-acetylglucosamine pyrophosphorylase/glucosamine-1-phosphate N-acetyltransferase
VKFCEDKLIRGTAYALYAARDFIDEDFILVYGDLFFDILNFSEIMDNENSIGIVNVKDVSRYGEVLFEGGYLKGIREKTGFGSGFANAGIYHLKTTILDFIEGMEESERKEYELTDSLQRLNEEGKERVKVIPLKGYWNDIGYPWDYIDANMYMLNKVKFAVGENTEIRDSAIIRKPAVIGEDCEIRNCVIEESVVGNGCVVGEFSVLKRSILMSNSKVPHLNYVADSVIAEGCNLGAGTKVANLRFDEANVKMNIKGKMVDSGRRKLGAIIGYNVKTGINVSIYPGVKISSGKCIEAESLVRRDV